MKISLTRNRLFMIGLMVIIVLVLMNKFNFIKGSELTTGIVINKVNWGKGRGYFIDPLIEFESHKSIYYFRGETNLPVEVGDIVPVIFKKNNPTKAKVYTFLGFWYPGMLWGLFPLMLLGAAVYSFVPSYYYYTFDLNKFFKPGKKDESGFNRLN